MRITTSAGNGARHTMRGASRGWQTIHSLYNVYTTILRRKTGRGKKGVYFR
jgi:hypothetical protein